MAIEDRDQLIEHPTFLEHIRWFFDPIDIDHMRRVAKLDLSTYEGVKAEAPQIYFQTSSGKMPLGDPDRKWPEQRVKTFRNWMADNYPMGVSVTQHAILAFDGSSARLARRNAAHLGSAEIDRVGQAFKALMDRPPEDPNGYFALAGIHWFPSDPPHCLHHESRYNPWHRVYLDRFEKALRTVPGCEDLCLPYWDILQPIPPWLLAPPFDNFTIPVKVADRYPAGFRTGRRSPTEIYASLRDYGVADDIEEALNSANFEGFTSAIERAHDGGHLSIGLGLAMGTPDIAAFDPIFWFFHCNWERMWWAWQKRFKAETLDAFRTLLSDTLWLDDPLFNALKPFEAKCPETIDASPYSYDELPSLFRPIAGVRTGNVFAETAFRLSAAPRVSLRVKGIDRLGISGSFAVHLLADGKTIARRGFFQSNEPRKCPSCVKRSNVDVDFMLNRDVISDKQLSVKIETLAPDRIDKWIPLSQVGAPTVNVRELLLSE